MTPYRPGPFPFRRLKAPEGEGLAGLGGRLAAASFARPQALRRQAP